MRSEDRHQTGQVNRRHAGRPVLTGNVSFDLVGSTLRRIEADTGHPLPFGEGELLLRSHALWNHGAQKASLLQRVSDRKDKGVKIPQDRIGMCTRPAEDQRYIQFSGNLAVRDSQKLHGS